MGRPRFRSCNTGAPPRRNAVTSHRRQWSYGCTRWYYCVLANSPPFLFCFPPQLVPNPHILSFAKSHSIAITGLVKTILRDLILKLQQNHSSSNTRNSFRFPFASCSKVYTKPKILCVFPSSILPKFQLHCQILIISHDPQKRKTRILFHTKTMCFASSTSIASSSSSSSS